MGSPLLSFACVDLISPTTKNTRITAKMISCQMVHWSIQIIGKVQSSVKMNSMHPARAPRRATTQAIQLRLPRFLVSTSCIWAAAFGLRQNDKVLPINGLQASFRVLL